VLVPKTEERIILWLEDRRGSRT